MNPSRADEPIATIDTVGLATVQDAGREGLTDVGVPRSGAWHRGRHRLAHALVHGTLDGPHPTLEILGSDMTLTIHQRQTLALVGVALVYQVRGVLLVGVAWGATMAWEHANNARWLLRVGAVAMGLFVLAQVAWNGLAVEDRVNLRAQLPDVVKTLDVVYNLKFATSSSERVQILSLIHI